jgi:hypothetical protein
MQLYWVGDRYVRTQGEAQKLGFGAVTEVPTDKDGLMGFLNALRAPEVPEPPNEPVEEPQPVLEESKHDAQLRQLDVEDAIQRANFTELMAYGNNVFDRFRDLGRQMENKS